MQMSLRKIFKKTVLSLISLSFFGYFAVSVYNYNDFVLAFSKHLSYLASDSLEGRGPGSVGSEKASEYIRDYLIECEINPLFNDSYFQYIPLRSVKPTNETKLIARNEVNEVDFELNQDYVLLHYGTETSITSFCDVVFVGYGISAPEFDYDDYIEAEAKNKIVVFLNGVPEAKHYGKDIQKYDNILYKIKNAMSRGAKGCIIIPAPTKANPNFWKYRLYQYQFDKISLAYALNESFAIMLNPDKAGFLFEDAAYSFAEVLELESRNEMKSFELKTKIYFKGKFREKYFLGKNIGGIINSNQKNREYILIGAHYDGLGIGPSMSGDSIYNGAFDNASGVSLSLELAKYFSKKKDELSSDLVFVFFDGEESGMLGSIFFCDNPPVPINKIKAMINIDAVSIFEETNSFYCIGLEETTIEPIFENLLKKNNLQKAEYMKLLGDGRLFAMSDHFTFQNYGVPAFMVIEGFDYKFSSKDEGIERYFNWIIEKYHSPFDDLYQPINLNAVYQYFVLIKDFVIELSKLKEISFKKESIYYSKWKKNKLSEK